MILAPQHGLPMRLDPSDTNPPAATIRGNMNALVDLPGEGGVF
jgi:hypothetical protein